MASKKPNLVEGILFFEHDIKSFSAPFSNLPLLMRAI